MSTYEAIKYNFVGTNLTALNGDNVSSGTVAAARVDSLAASKITSGSFDAARIPDLSAAKITSGTMDGSRISGGTFGAVNGSALTSLPSSAPSTSQVASATAGISVGAVGSYAQIKINATKSPGNTFSGGNSDYQYGVWTGSTLPSGTWRVMGKTYSGNDSGRVTVGLRIS